MTMEFRGFFFQIFFGGFSFAYSYADFLSKENLRKYIWQIVRERILLSRNSQKNIQRKSEKEYSKEIFKKKSAKEYSRENLERIFGRKSTNNIWAKISFKRKKMRVLKVSLLLKKTLGNSSVRKNHHQLIFIWARITRFERKSVKNYSKESPRKNIRKEAPRKNIWSFKSYI